MTPKVFDTLVMLVERPGQLVQKDECMRRLWPETVVGDAAVAETMSRLRRAVGDDDGELIETVPRRGYRFVAAVRQVAAEAAPAVAVVPASLESRPLRVQRLRAAAVLVVGFGAPCAYFARSTWHRSEVKLPSRAVLPLENLSGDTCRRSSGTDARTRCR